MTDIHLGPNRYGKSGIRLATVDRDGDTHTFTDLEVEIRVEGDFVDVHTRGDNAKVLTTDTMRGTCFALARDGIGTPAGYARRLAERFLATSPAVARVSVEVTAYPWERVQVDGAPHDHTFRPAAGGESITTVTQERDGTPTVTGGVRGARVLKSTGSAFSGYLVDDLTTLPPTRDRIMATTVDASWGVDATDDAVARLAATIPATFLARFATHDDSESVQHTLWEMGQAVLAAHPEVGWIRFVLPNEHHILADLSPYGLHNPNHVFLVADRPYGVIEGVVARDGVDVPTPW